MQVRGLSATAIRDYLQCKLKLVFRYDPDVPSIKNDHARIGIAVHEALEQFVRRMINKKSFPDPSDYEFTIATFMNSAVNEGLSNMNFYTEGRKMLTAFVDKYDPSEEIIAVEERFKLVTPDNVPIAGAMDKVIKVNEDTIAIIDYKTSKNALTTHELKDDIQLSMYDLAASILWPQYKNRLLFLDYVRIDKSVSTYRSDEDRLAFREFLVSIWTQIQKLQEEEVTGRINPLCGWCDYREHCPAYADIIRNDSLELAPLTDLNDAEFLEQWESVSAKRAILEGRQRELKMIAHEKFMRGEEIAAEGRELYSSQQSRTNYDIEQVVKLIPQRDLLSVLAVNKARLDRYVKEDPELRNRLSKIAQVSYNMPTYKTRASTSLPVEEVLDAGPNEDEDAA